MKVVISFSHSDSRPANHSSTFLHNPIFQPRTLALLGAAVLILLFLASQGHAQGSKVSAALEGTVRDGSGAVISGAAVTVVNPTTN
jgi:threonine/homoserine/homoserine lactone efflux protein